MNIKCVVNDNQKQASSNASNKSFSCGKLQAQSQDSPLEESASVLSYFSNAQYDSLSSKIEAIEAKIEEEKNDRQQGQQMVLAMLKSIEEYVKGSNTRAANDKEAFDQEAFTEFMESKELRNKVEIEVSRKWTKRMHDFR